MEVSRIFDILYWQQEKYPKADCLAGKYDGEWKKFSTQQVIDLSDSLAIGLLSAGFDKGDPIAVISDNCVEWTLTDQGVMKMGGILVPLYPTSSEADLTFIINHANIKAIFVQTPDLYAKINNIKGNTPSLKKIYTFQTVTGADNWSILQRPVSDADRAQLKAIQNPIRPDDLATIIYTSGTTGNPKGVMLSHRNLASNVLATEEVLPINNTHRAISFLPLSHIYERMVIYTYLYMGVSVYYAESMDKIGDNIREVKPNVFTAVPRLLEKVFDRIMAKGAELKGPKKMLFNWAVKLGLQWEPDRKNGGWYHFKLKIADIVFKKWREALGNEVVAVCSGSAALQPRLLRIFNAAGIPLVEGYGLTETSPVISVGGFTENSFKVGYVGRVITGGQVKIATDGEILYKGPNLMMGYYKRDDLTSEVIDGEGWFHTGDIGELDKDGFLRITDRKKEMFKTSGGKYIAPQLLENKLKESRYVEQCAVIGEYRKFPSVLIVPAFAALREHLKSEGKNTFDGDNAKLVASPDVLKLLQEAVDQANAGLGQYEKLKKFTALPAEWSVNTGEMTPKLSLRRKVIDEKYKQQIEAMYAE